MNIFIDGVYLPINTEKTDENILRYLKFIVISGNARTQKKWLWGFSKRIFAVLLIKA